MCKGDLNFTFLDIGNGMFDNIVSHRDRFEESSKKSARVTGTFDPWKLVEGYVKNIKLIFVLNPDDFLLIPDSFDNSS